MKVKTKNKPLVLFLLGIFALVVFFFTTQTISDYLRYRNGEIISGTITDIDRDRVGRRGYEITATVEKEGKTYTDTFHAQSSKIAIGGVGMVPTRDLKEGDAIDMVIVTNKDGRDAAIAERVLHLWPELFWEIVILLIIIFFGIAFWKKGKY